MIWFTLIGAALIGVALLALLPPLLQSETRLREKQLLKDSRRKLRAAQSQAEAKKAAEQLLASETAPSSAVEDDKKPLTALLVAFLIPVLAVALYLQLGSPQLLGEQPPVATNSDSPHGHGQNEAGNIEELVAKLETSLQEQPDNAEGWYLLARTYMSMQAFQKGADAMAKVIALVGEQDADLLVQYADALSMAEGGKLSGKPLEYVDKALKLNPNHPEALWIKGIAASQTGDLNQAINTWRKAAAQLQDRPEAQAELRQMISKAEARLATGETVSEAEVAPDVSPSDSTGKPSIRVAVSIDPALRPKVAPSDTVFIFARAPSGPPMPVAAFKTTVASLPMTITLDDSQAMLPSLKLSGLDEAYVSARVSKSGQPGVQPGDLEATGTVVAVKPDQSISLVINQVH